MAKTIRPMHSENATGKFAKNICFQNNKQINTTHAIYPKKKKKSQALTNFYNINSTAVHYWKNNITEIDRNFFSVIGRKYNLPGYHHFLSLFKTSSGILISDDFNEFPGTPPNYNVEPGSDFVPAADNNSLHFQSPTGTISQITANKNSYTNFFTIAQNNFLYYKMKLNAEYNTILFALFPGISQQFPTLNYIIENGKNNLYANIYDPLMPNAIYTKLLGIYNNEKIISLLTWETKTNNQTQYFMYENSNKILFSHTQTITYTPTPALIFACFSTIPPVMTIPTSINLQLFNLRFFAKYKPT